MMTTVEWHAWAVASRNALGLSQSRLARLSGVTRFKICTAELGDDSFSSEDQRLITIALRAEAARLHAVALEMESKLKEHEMTAD